MNTLELLEVAVREFHILTGRPLDHRAVGHAYVRCQGLQQGNRYSFGVIITPGGGVRNVQGFSGLYLGEMLRLLRHKLRDAEFIRSMKTNK